MSQVRIVLLIATFALAWVEFSVAQVLIEEHVTIGRGTVTVSQETVEVYDAVQQTSTGQDSVAQGVYAMFAGDENADCQITVKDFNPWLVATKAVTKGYFNSDFNIDAQATALDFNLWLVNTKAAIEATDDACRHNNLIRKYVGQPLEAASKTSIAAELEAKVRITGNAANGLLNVRLVAETKPASEVDTLGSFTYDIYYNSDQLTYGFLMNTQGLLDAGFVVTVDSTINEYGSLIRVQARDPNSTYVIGSEYKLLRLRFWEKNGPITNHDIAFSLASLGVSAISDGKFEDFEEITPIYDDVYTY